MSVELTYLGTAMVALQLGGSRLLTDPVLDPRGSRYHFGPPLTPRRWYASQKAYDTPAAAGEVQAVDAVLLSHDHHGDNLDRAGRAFLADPARAPLVLTTVPGAGRLAAELGERVRGLRPGGRARVGAIEITATVARHGPWYTPRIHQVIGFLLDVDGGPRVWISGDTVLFPALAETLARIRAERPVDLAIVHCGGVSFPAAPAPLRRARFTFDAAEAVQACRALEPRLIVPVHRSGWTHFVEPEAKLRAAFASAGLGERTGFLELGERVSF